jgi:hypothetical protein
MRLLLLWASICALALRAQDTPPPAQPQEEKSKLLSVKTTKLFADPGENAIYETLRYGAEGKVAVVVSEMAKHRVYMSGKELKPYPWIVPPELMRDRNLLRDPKVATIYTEFSNVLKFTPDYQTLYYVAYTEKGFAVVSSDGWESGNYDLIPGNMPVISPDSRRIAFIAAKDKLFYVGTNSSQSTPYDDIQSGTLVFSPDGSRLAYSAKKGPEWTVFCEGQPNPGLDGIAEGSPKFSPDSKKLAYIAFKGNKQAVYLDGKQVGELFDAVAEWTLTFSPDSSALVYAAKSKGKWNLYAGEKVYGPFDAVGEEPPIHSKDGARLIWVARKGAYWYVFENGQEIQAGGQPLQTDAILLGTPVLSPDSSKLAFGIKRNQKWSVWCQGQESDSFDSIKDFSIVFTKDSSKLAFVGLRKGMFVPVVNMKEVGAFQEVGPLRASRDPTSGVVAYAVKRRKTVKEMDEERALDPRAKVSMNAWSVYINHEEMYGPYDELQPFAVTVSPNGTKVAYPAFRRKHWALWIDGARRTDDLPLWITFNDQNMMEMVALNPKEGYVYLQEVLQ